MIFIVLPIVLFNPLVVNAFVIVVSAYIGTIAINALVNNDSNRQIRKILNQPLQDYELQRQKDPNRLTYTIPPDKDTTVTKQSNKIIKETDTPKTGETTKTEINLISQPLNNQDLTSIPTRNLPTKNQTPTNTLNIEPIEVKLSPNLKGSGTFIYNAVENLSVDYLAVEILN